MHERKFEIEVFPIDEVAFEACQNQDQIHFDINLLQFNALQQKTENANFRYRPQGIINDMKLVIPLLPRIRKFDLSSCID